MFIVIISIKILLTLILGRQAAAATTCTLTLQNGEFSNDCSFKLNVICSFTCNYGYRPVHSLSTLKCQDNGKWEYQDSDICRRECPLPAIPSGEIMTSLCKRASGDICPYTCDEGFQQNKMVPALKCVDGRWNVGSMNILCRPKPKCPELPSSEYRGYLEFGCLRVVNSTCMFYCDIGYEGGFYDLKCLPDQIWNRYVETLCYAKCSLHIPDGRLSHSCNRLPGTECQYSCNYGFSKNQEVTSIYCTYAGSWNVGVKSLCNSDSRSGIGICPEDFKTAYFDDGCTRRPGVECVPHCKQGYAYRGSDNHVTCQEGGYWTPDPHNICFVSNDDEISEKEKQRMDMGIGFGVVVLCFFICVLAFLFVVLKRRGFLRWSRRTTNPGVVSSNEIPSVVSNIPMPPSYDDLGPPPYQEQDSFHILQLLSPPPYSDVIKDDRENNSENQISVQSENQRLELPDRNTSTEQNQTNEQPIPLEDASVFVVGCESSQPTILRSVRETEV